MLLDPKNQNLLNPLSDKRTERYQSKPTSRAVAAQDPRQENARRRTQRDFSPEVRRAYRVKGR